MNTLYHKLIGSLLHLTTNREDISFSLGVYALFKTNHKVSYLNVVKRIIEYISGTYAYLEFLHTCVSICTFNSNYLISDYYVLTLCMTLWYI